MRIAVAVAGVVIACFLLLSVGVPIPTISSVVGNGPDPDETRLLADDRLEDKTPAFDADLDADTRTAASSPARPCARCATGAAPRRPC